MTDEARFAELLESDQSDAEVQYQLGLCYLRGLGVDQDGAQAEAWLRRAADQGHVQARELLSSRAPEPKPQAPELTEETLPDWCVAAEDGDAEARYQVALFFLERDIPGGREDAERYLAMAVDQGHPMACLVLARQRLEQEQYEEAVHLLRNAADCGLTEAMELLAVSYGLGRGVKQDLKEAELWFNRFADLGGGEEKLALARRYKNGDLVPLSPARALSWLRKAQEDGAENAEDRFYAEEREADRQEAALEERVRRAEQEGPESLLDLAGDLLEGRDVPQDKARGIQMIRRLAEEGYAPARTSTPSALPTATGWGRTRPRPWSGSARRRTRAWGSPPATWALPSKTAAA